MTTTEDQPLAVLLEEADKMSALYGEFHHVSLLLGRLSAALRAQVAEGERVDQALKAGDTAGLPPGYGWGRDAMESFEFGREQAMKAVRAALQPEPEKT